MQLSLILRIPNPIFKIPPVLDLSYHFSSARHESCSNLCLLPANSPKGPLGQLGISHTQEIAWSFHWPLLHSSRVGRLGDIRAATVTVCHMRIPLFWGNPVVASLAGFTTVLF